MRYKVGDTVVLKDGLLVGGLYDSVIFTKEMESLMGEEVLISSKRALPEVHQCAYGIGDGFFISEFMINHYKTALIIKDSSLDLLLTGLDMESVEDFKKTSMLSHYECELMESLSKDTKYRVNIRQKSGRVYRLEMSELNFRNMLDMLHLRKEGDFIEVESQIINIHEAEHIEYFEIEETD